MARNDHFGVVYSTEHGKTCPQCGKPIKQCICHGGPSHRKVGGVSGDGIVRIGRETKGRKGKGMTIITGIPLAGDALKKLTKELKQFNGPLILLENSPCLRVSVVNSVAPLNH